MPTQKYQFSSLVDKDNLRKLTLKTIETYPPDWVVIHEALQNAKDAIQRSSKVRGNVTVVLDLASQKVSITDDGRGFTYDKSLFGLGGTDKDLPGLDQARINGNQGVGLKVVIFCTETFRIESVNSGKKWEAWVEAGHRYCAGEEVEIHVTEPVDTPQEPGTVVEYTFPKTWVSDFIQSIYDGHYLRIVDEIAPTDVDKLRTAVEYYFRTYSYAGDVNRLVGDSGAKPVVISVSIVYDQAEKPDGIGDQLWDILKEVPEVKLKFENKHWDVVDAIGRVPARRPKPHVLDDLPLPEAGEIGRRSENYFWVARFSSVSDYQKLLLNNRLRKPIDPQGYSTLFDRTMGIYVLVGARSRLEKFLIGPPRQFIAASGVPSVHSLQTPTRGGEATYVTNNIHFIMNLSEKLNYGKQTISNPWLLGMANRFFADAVRATLRNVARCIVGNVLGTSTADDIESIEEVETDIVGREDLGLDDVSFIKVPHDENALIAIFYELIGRQHLEGIRTYSLHQKTTYDGRVVMRTEGQDDFPDVRTDAHLKNLEFKLKLSALVYDFEEGLKNPGQVSLAVVWEDDLPSNHPNFQAVDIETTRDADRRIPNAELALVDRRTGRTIQVLVLKRVVDRLRQA